MPIKEINNNGKSKIISRKTGVMTSPNNGISSKQGVHASSHSVKPVVDLGHADSTIGDNEGKTHESKESKSFEAREDSGATSRVMKKVVSDKGRGGSGMKGSY